MLADGEWHPLSELVIAGEPFIRPEVIARMGKDVLRARRRLVRLGLKDSKRIVWRTGEWDREYRIDTNAIQECFECGESFLWEYMSLTCSPPCQAVRRKRRHAEWHRKRCQMAEEC